MMNLLFFFFQIYAYVTSPRHFCRSGFPPRPLMVASHLDQFARLPQVFVPYWPLSAFSEQGALPNNKIPERIITDLTVMRRYHVVRIGRRCALTAHGAVL